MGIPYTLYFYTMQVLRVFLNISSSKLNMPRGKKRILDPWILWILMDPGGSCRFWWILLILMDPVDPIGSWWILLDPDGSCWILMDPVGSWWILLDPDGSCWILMDPDGSWTMLKYTRKLSLTFNLNVYSHTNVALGCIQLKSYFFPQFLLLSFSHHWLLHTVNLHDY
jgi:hypothetical protein